MKIKYAFLDGTVTEVEVSDEIGAVIIDSRKAEHAQDERHRYHCYSYDAIDYEGEEYGYKKIATITGLPQNTVKSYCSRHPVQKNDFAESEGLCRNCKKPLEQTPHKRQKKFCSDFCRMAWWNNHPELVQRKAYYTVTCAHYGKRFESYGNVHRRFCSRACYAEYRRKEPSYD